VEVSRFAEGDGQAFRDAYGYQASEKIVLCVSRIDYQKNQLSLIRSFSLFAKAHPEHRLVLMGPVTVEAYYHKLLNEIKDLGLERKIRIIPGLEPDNPLLTGAYQAAQFFVLASRYEPFGIVILEAWAAGLPVVAHNVGGIPGFCTDHENVLLVELDDEARLVECMRELAHQEELRTTLSRKAFQKVSEQFDWPVVVREIRTIYEDLVKK
jgi:glycosyltransferase involved in cell wall biosynthesis